MRAIRRGLRRARALVAEHGLWASGVLSVAVFGAMVAYADADRTGRAFAGFDWRAFAAVLALATVGYGFRFAKWELYLRELDVDVARRTSAVAFFSGLMMVLTPGKAGEVWKAWFLRDRSGVPAARTTSVVGAERVTDVLALSLLAATGLVAFDRSSAVILGVVSAFALGVGLLQWRSLCLRVLARAGTLPLVGAYAGGIEALYEDAYALFRLRPLLLGTASSVVAWGLEGLALWAALAGFGVEADPLVGLFVFGLGSVVGAVSMLPGGLAATEASMVGLLLTFGHARPVAVGATLVLRVGTLWYAALLGVSTFAAYKFLAGRPGRAAASDPPEP